MARTGPEGLPVRPEARAGRERGGRRSLRRTAAVAGVFAAAAALVLGSAAPAFAHPVGASAVTVTVQSDRVDALLQIPVDRFAQATGIALEDSAASLREKRAQVDLAILSGFGLQDDAGVPYRLTVTSAEIGAVNGQPALVSEVTASPAAGRISGDIALTDTIVSAAIPTHRIYVFLASDVMSGRVSEAGPELLGVLDGDTTHLGLHRPDESWWTAFGAMVGLGLQHIKEGTDHVLFLLTLLLIAPVVAMGRRWGGRRTARAASLHMLGIVSSFTAGHTLSLALVSFGIVRFPEAPVEFLVSFSILIAAVHAFRPLMRRGEILVGAVFGLVHGTAFATTIVDLGLDAPSTVVAVLGFNVGVELAQLIVVLLVLPLLLLLVRTPSYHWVRRAVSVFSAAASISWMAAIVTGGESILTPVFDFTGAYALPIYSVAAAAAVGAWLASRPVAAPNRVVASEQELANAIPGDPPSASV